jgi:hypothetical protein
MKTTLEGTTAVTVPSITEDQEWLTTKLKLNLNTFLETNIP